MPIRKLVTADAASIVSCVNECYAYLRNKNVLGIGVGDWSVTHLQRLNAAGFSAYGYVNAQGRVDAVAVYRIDTFNHPIAGFPNTVGTQKWIRIISLAFRPSAVPDTPTSHATYFWRALKLLIPDGVNNSGAVGTVFEFDSRNTDLHNLMANNFPSTANFELSEELTPGMGAFERCWLPVQPGLPLFTAVTANV